MSESGQISKIVESLLQSYDSVGAINHVGGANLPSQEHIVDVLQALRKVLFPGFYDQSPVEATTLPYLTGERVVWIYRHLSEEINRCLCYECRENGHCERIPACQERSRQIALDLLRELPQIRALLQLDVEATLSGDPAARSSSEVILAYPGIAAITVYRLAHFLYQREVPLLPRIMTEHIHSLTGIDIHPGASIGHSFSIDHGTGIVIGETTTIGNRVKLYQGVTLGALSVARSMQGVKRHPTIEDDVIVYAGATILGGDTVVGHNSVIGGNVWLVESVPPHSTVYNPPAASRPVVTPRHRGERAQAKPEVTEAAG
jgi:serine O-acetyltransferase